MTPTSRYIDMGTLAAAAYYHRKGETLKCWETLRDGGDGYARIASHVFSGEHSWINCVRQFHWQMTSGLSFNDEAWKKIGHRAQENYLRLIGHEPVQRPDGSMVFRLPNTRNVEHCYLAALHGMGISSETLMHVAANQFSRPINRCFERAARGLARVAPEFLARRLRRIDMPDWHEVLGSSFGDLGGRGYDNSPNGTCVGYWRNARNMAWSMVGGTARFIRTRAQRIPARTASPV